ncbi:MAG: hypothetical protein HPY57_16095 [Ignavibacteria bacterium]|nr:hypothetical protein [Ignavibacteria bacterium]
MRYTIKTTSKNKFIKTFEVFLGGMLHKTNYDNLENISKPKDGIGGEVDQFTKNRILNVQNFNKWLANDWTGYGDGKGAPGIVGRVDKLSPSMIEDYFFDQGVQCSDREIFDFIDKIRGEWLKK